MQAIVAAPAIAGLSADDAIAGFPVDLMMILVGVTYLFNVARANGTVDWLIAGAVAAVRGRTPFIPWIMFLLTALLSAVGAVFSPPIVAPIALAFAARHRIPQPMMGILVVHGAAAGSLSPISVYGVTVAGVLESSGLPNDPWGLFGIAFLASLLPAIAVFVFYRGYRLRHVETGADPASTAGPGSQDAGSELEPPATSAAATASAPSAPTATVPPGTVVSVRPTLEIVLTTLAIAGVVSSGRPPRPRRTVVIAGRASMRVVPGSDPDMTADLR